MEIVFIHQRLQLSACFFVCNKYVSKKDLIRINWLPIKERKEFNLLKLVFKALHFKYWPDMNRLKLSTFNRTLGNSNDTLIEITQERDSFQFNAYNLFNNLPKDIRNINGEDSYNQFCSLTKQHLMNIARNEIIG